MPSSSSSASSASSRGSSGSSSLSRSPSTNSSPSPENSPSPSGGPSPSPSPGPSPNPSPSPSSSTNSSPSISSSGNKPLILLFGYWPPTGNDWMLAEYANGGKDVGNYHVAAYSPTFGQPLGWQSGSPPNQLIPWWGPGSGHPLVDFQDTANFFWVSLNVPANNPIAIMSFSRGGEKHYWYLEAEAYNYANADWETDLYGKNGIEYYPLPTPTYPPPRGTGTLGGIPTPVPVINAPYIGGGPGDPSPRKHDTPQTGGPPDPSMAAGVSRSSSLPTSDIVTAINAAISTSKVDPQPLDDPSELGKYVSGYMAYLVCWYGHDTGVQPANAAIRQYGHTHVGLDIAPADAKIALHAQVNALTTWLDSH